MARVVNKNVNGVLYLQVVEDYRESDGVWKQKVLKSFGPASNAQNYFEAVQYAAAVNAFKERAPAERNGPNWDDLAQAATIVIGTIALAWLLSHVLRRQ